MTDKFCPEYEILARSVSSSGSQLFSQFRDRVFALADVKTAGIEANRLRLGYFLSKLNDHQRSIYEILRVKGKLDSGSLYRAYCREVGNAVANRAYRKYMRKMVELGLVIERGSGRWRTLEIVM